MLKKSKRSLKSKERSHEEFEEDIQENIRKQMPKTNYCGLLETKEGMDILRKMSWVEIEELTDYEFYGQ
jgi:hypothetical protein